MGDDTASASLVDALILASKSGYADDLSDLIKTDVDINTKDPLGNTGLHYAAGGGHTEAVKILLSHPKVDVNAANNVGDTPLHKAASRGREDVARQLVDSGGDVNIKNKDDKRPVDLVSPKFLELGGMLKPKVIGPSYSSDEEEEDEEYSPASDNLSGSDTD